MILTPADKEEIQEKLLAMCNAASRLGIGEERLLRALQRFGFETLTLEQLQTELRIIETAGLISTVEKQLRPDLLRWKTTGSGDTWLMKQGLI
jgi:hypothetical protein